MVCLGFGGNKTPRSRNAVSGRLGFRRPVRCLQHLLGKSLFFRQPPYGQNESAPDDDECDNHHDDG
ncbi:hypothetical protein NEISICOT_00741 [Neisseria sicca ATCC 29256]|uniref:Uncharacterized protein n=1 Tax=Neisseria sicca ATCC 29256 TaxID=547045 RepID=C6M2K2_NEISI|nr:hypothetical protein NEISICOT_00741 [Neisseria sicca ATCC 29256]